jgi:DNA uptake protein ComE-like DNA-binding protein
MPASATVAPKPAAAKARTGSAAHAPASHAPARITAGPKTEAATPGRAAAPALPAFARPATAHPVAAAHVPIPLAAPKAAAYHHDPQGDADSKHPATRATGALKPAVIVKTSVKVAGHPHAASMQHAHPGASPKQAATHTVHAKPGEHAHAAYAAPKPHADTARHIAPPPPVAKPVAPAPPAHKPSAPSAHAPKPGPRLAPLAASKTPSHGGGQPLAPHIKEAIQNSLMVDLSSVRLHASTAAERKAQSLKARAFTFGNDIFLGHGEHPTDLTLITHEAAHVIQQQSASHVQAWSNDRGDRFEREADSAAAAVSRGETFAVRERVESPRVQRFGISDALDWLADKAYNIPGFRMFTIVLGVNPINMEHTDRSAGNVLRAVVEFIPGGALITQALDKYGVFDKVGNWVQQQLDTLGMIGSSIKQALMDFLDSLSWRDIFHLGDVWDRAKRIFTDPIDRIKDFVVGLLEGIWKFVREAILKPIASLASKTSGWDLLCAVMAKNPITGEAVPRTPDTLIGGFMKLIHEDEIWNNIKKANAVSRAFAWFQNVLSGLLGFVSQIPDLFIQALKSLEWSDILDLPGGFMKIVGVFGKFLGNFISWAGGKVWDLLQIIFEVVAPSVMPYLKKVGAAFKSILKNPMRFVHTLVDAAKLGFNNFRAHFVTHLLAGIIDWLTKSLSGVYIPKALSLPEFGKFALSVLGISWPQIRAKIVKALGPNGDSIMKGLETTFDVLVALFNGGPAAAWNLIQEKLTGLKDMVLDGIVSLAVDAIVKTAIPKLIAMFIPGAGFISAILSIYGTIKTFIEQLSKLAATVKAFLDSLVAMANGQIDGAAAKVESSLGGFLSLAISFLAGFFGLGNIASKVMGVIEKVRATVDKALDVAINWIVGKAKALLGAAKGAVKGAVQRFTKWWTASKTFRAADGKTHTLLFSGEEQNAVLHMRSVDTVYSDFVNGLQAGADPAKSTAKQEAARISGLIDKERSTPPAGNTPDEIEESRKKKATLVNSLLDELKTHTATLLGPTIPDSAEPHPGPLNAGNFATSMIVKPLTNKKRSPGTDPTSSANATYAALNERRDSPGGASYYIKGHLLNQQLGGKGNWDNLVPLSRSGNAQHEVQAESIVKRTVDLPAIVEYSVVPNFGARSDKGALLSAIIKSAEPAETKRVKSAIVEAEDLAPNSMTVQAHILDETLTRKNAVISKNIPNAIERSYGSYYLSSTPKPIQVNLSVDGVDKIMTLPGIGEVLAQRIVDARQAIIDSGGKRFSSYKQIAEKVTGIGEGKLKELGQNGNVTLY